MTSIHDSNEETAEVTETQVRFQTSSSGQDCELIGPDSGNTRMYTYLTEQAAKPYAEFPQSVKGCIHTVDVLVDRNSVPKENVSTREKKGISPHLLNFYLTKDLIHVSSM